MEVAKESGVKVSGFTPKQRRNCQILGLDTKRTGPNSHLVLRLLFAIYRDLPRLLLRFHYGRAEATLFNQTWRGQDET